MRGQIPQMFAFGVERSRVAAVTSHDDITNKRFIGFTILKVAMATQHQRLIDRLLQMAVRGLHAAVLVGHADVVACAGHAVMQQQRVIASREVLFGLQILERCRQAVRAMLVRAAAGLPQRVLQTGGQCLEALAAFDDIGVFPVREREHKVIEPVIKGRAGDRHLHISHVGEVRESLHAGQVLLREEDLLAGTLERAPLVDAPLERAPHAVRKEARMRFLQLAQQRDGLQLRGMA
ncbi:hypothetical protein Y026_5823 [Burkholderia pseudomallei TSV28]|nr:hypothetical protein Y026_5823 [Burkholderia pseudomallei TSV28]